MTEPVEHLTVGSLQGLCDGWRSDRPVWLQSSGGALERAVWGDHLERGGDGGEALVLRSWAPGDEPAAATVWVLEWAAPQGILVPPTTAFRTEAGALAAIAAEARRVGAELVEEDRPGVLRMIWAGPDLVAMLRVLELQP